MTSLVIATVLSLVVTTHVHAWGSSSEGDSSVYGNALTRDWLYDGSTISLKLQGCLWGFVSDNEESGCMEESSEDGTTYWYQMANCRRAQAVFNLYTGSGCSKFQESVSQQTTKASTASPISHDSSTVCYHVGSGRVCRCFAKWRQRQCQRR